MFTMMAKSSVSRHAVFVWVTGLVLLTVVFGGFETASAERNAKNEEKATYAVISADNVYVRAGAGDSYYPFGKVHKGAIVKVVGEKHFWARVHTMGPAFKDFFGYVRYPRGESSRLRLENDGRTARTLGRVDLLAPNMNTDYRPGDSWKRILLLPADTTLKVLETIETERYTVFKVALPANAEGWISTSFVTPATAQQVERWKTAIASPAKPTPLDDLREYAEEVADAVLARDEPALDPVGTPTAPPEMTDPANAVTPSGVVAETAEETGDPDRAERRAPITYKEHDPIVEPFTDPIRDPIGDPMPIDRTARAEIAEEAADRYGAPGVTGTVRVVEETPQPEVRTPSPTAMRAVPETPTKGITTPTSTPRERLEDLETVYQLLRAEPIQTAEVLPLRQLYLALADDATDERAVSRFAAARAEQLTIWADLQKRRAELDKLRKRVDVSAEEAEAVRIAQEAAGSYVAVGRLTASIIYDGRRLPRLFRVQDIATGRTVAYMRPDDGIDLHGMLGQVVGVAGKRSYEGKMRINIVEPTRIDLLASPTTG